MALANIIGDKKPATRIGKNQMKAKLEREYPDKHISNQQLIGILKDKNIQYSPKFRCNNVQGCYYLVKFKKSSDNDDDKHYDEGIDFMDRSISCDSDELKIKYDQLLEKYNILKSENDLLNSNHKFTDAFDIIRALNKRFKE